MRAAGRRRWPSALLALALVAATASPAAAEQGWGYELANELMSPYCPGRALAECPSPQAGELRQWILDQESAGVPRAQVEAQLFQRWGDQLRQAPRATGVGLVAYLIPIFVLIAGGGLVALFLRRQREGAAPSAVPRLAPVDPDLERQLEDELRKSSGGSW
jgi:cytochrome c-type biogenesis protein CcmH/NrfF